MIFLFGNILNPGIFVQAIVVCPFAERAIGRLPRHAPAALLTERQNLPRIVVLREILTQFVNHVLLFAAANFDGAQVVGGVSHDEREKEIKRPRIVPQPPAWHSPKARWSHAADYLAEGVGWRGCEQFRNHPSQAAGDNWARTRNGVGPKNPHRKAAARRTDSIPVARSDSTGILTDDGFNPIADRIRMIEASFSHLANSLLRKLHATR